MNSYSVGLQDLVSILSQTVEKKKETNMIQTGNFIIGSLSENDSHISLSTTPLPHGSRANAGREAERLARVSPGKRYVVLEVAGIVEARALVWK